MRLFPITMLQMTFALLFALACDRSPGQVNTSSGQQSLDGRATCKKFVQDFYDWYTSPVTKTNQKFADMRDIDDVLQEKPLLFTSDLLRLLRADRAAQQYAHELVGLDFDPFANSQDPSPIFRVQSVELKDHSCTALVWGMEQGIHHETVTPVLKKDQGQWKFANFQYRGEDGSPEKDLITQLIELRKTRATETPKKR